MVSLMLVAGRHLAVFALFLCLLCSLALPPDALARNPYQIRDGHEGDPGDGVLDPAPVVDPHPTPKGRPLPIFTVIMIMTDDNSFVPMFQIVGFTGTPLLSHTRLAELAVQEGRWHRAP